MNLIDVIFLAFALSIDAMAVSFSNGLLCVKNKRKNAFLLALFAGFFQFLMPVIGFFAGAAVVSYIGAFDHYVAFVLLAYVSFKMLKDAFSKEENEGEDVCKNISYFTIFVLAVATSIDALALGVSVGLLYDKIFFFASIVGITCFMISFLGSLLGTFLSQIKSLDKILNIIGATVLFGIGLKVLYDHGVFNF